MTLAQNYKAERATDRGVSVIRLTDSVRGVEVAIAPTIGNMAYEMNVHGHNILWTPAPIDELQKLPQMSGIPFLAPWAHRLGPQGFWSNGKKYALDMELGNVRGATPIHGLISASSLWKVTEVAADKKSAH